jgi:uncharacterized protein (DUF2236 family)
VNTQAVVRRRIIAQLGGELPVDDIRSGSGPGWFGPDSVVWRVHQDPCLLVGGVAALLTQTLHPLAMAGVAEHSAYETDPWGRLQRTSMFLANTIYGDAACAERSVEIVRTIHRRVAGVAPDGRPYAATDPRLLLFVHVTEVAGFLRAYQRHGDSPLTAAASDQYVAEMAVIAEALGSDPAPRDVAELDACLDSFSGELAAGTQALRAVSFLRGVQVEPALRPGYRYLFDAACALLDRGHATLLGLDRAARCGRVGRNGTAISAALRWALGPSPVAAAAAARLTAGR